MQADPLRLPPERRARQIELEAQNQQLREANQRLEDTFRRYQELYDFAPVGYFSLDRQGKIQAINLTAAKILDRPRSEIRGRKLHIALPPEDRDILDRHLRLVFTSEKTQTCVLRLRSANKAQRAYRFQSRLYGDPQGNLSCRSVAVDITAAKKSQEELAAANLLNESIVQSVGDSLVVLDERLRVVSANPSFFSTFRLDPSSILGRSLWAMAKGRWYPLELRRRLEQLAAGGKAFDGLELAADFPGAGRRELSITARPLKQGTKGFRRIFLSIRDLTEQKEAERRVRSAVARLEEANLQLRQFASVVAHDLKNPLRAIANYAGFLEQDLAETLPAEQRGYLEEIRAAVESAEEQITGLLALSRIREVDLECRKIRLGSMLGKLVKSTTATKAANIRLCNHWPTLVTEPTLLHQVLSNLLDNAVKYNSSKPINVELGWNELPERQVELFVRDNGPGIAPQHQEKIFLAFRRLHSPRTVKGSGLGLSIVRAAVDRLGGSIRLDSKPGKGSTFYVRLPVDGPEGDPHTTS